jgi:galactose mutarotase-like enzyme
MTTLENEYLKVSIRSKGAELTSLYDKIANVEHLWQADPKVWAWHAPNLFPVIGECIDKQLRIEGKGFKMERHGFARQASFKLVNQTQTQATYSLESDNATLQIYPYHFEFVVSYQLINNRLTVTYRVVNNGNESMYFSVGGHPAFNLPFHAGESYQDYYLEFESDDKLDRHLLTEAGLFNGATEPVLLESGKLPLSKMLFEKDALVFKNLHSRKVSLKSSQHKSAVTIEYGPFNYLGIWAKPGADFLCIEPWLGCADTEGRRVDISHKEGIQRLEVGKTFDAAFSIEIN